MKCAPATHSRVQAPVNRLVIYLRRLAGVAVVSSLLAFPTAAGVNKWTASLAMPTSQVAIDPVDSKIAYATTEVGIFKTVDRGSEWRVVEEFPNARAIAIDPRNSARVVAGNFDGYWDSRSTYRAQLRLSEDAGATWRTVHTFEWESHVAALSFDGSDSTVYAALSNSGVGKSADGGKTWTISDNRNGLLCCLVDFYHTLDVAVAPNPSASASIYAASDSFFRSTDGARTWQRISLPQPFGTPSEELEAWTVSVDPSDSARLYVTGYFQPNKGPGAVTSGNGGLVWRLLPVKTTSRIIIDPLVPTTLYTTGSDTHARPEFGVLRSTDRGETWNEFNTGLPMSELNVWSLTVDQTGSLLYASTSAGVFVYEVRPQTRGRAVRKRN